MKIEKVDKNTFLQRANQVKFKHRDNREAQQMGFSNVKDAFARANHAWANYYVFSVGSNDVAFALEQRDGVFTFFVTQNMKESYALPLVRKLRKITDERARCTNVIMTSVAHWFSEAKRLLRIVGFVPFEIGNHFEVWIKENGK
jgi:hypothetical protein